MVHRYFEFAANDKNEIDKIAGVPSGRKFSSIFKELFPTNGEFSPNLTAWLDAITKEFDEDSYVRKCDIRRTMRNFRGIRTSPTEFFNDNDSDDSDSSSNDDDEDDKRTLYFWIYLFWVHQQIRYRESDKSRDDKVFKFMRDFPIFKTRIVILGQDPLSYQASHGYAFHNNLCPATTQLLEFLKMETDLLTRIGSPDLEVDAFQLNSLECDLSWWIKQNVLLLNSNLIPTGDIKHSNNPWEAFTDFIIRCISKNCKHVVFILSGAEAAKKNDLINKKKHKVINLYHPAWYCRLNPNHPDFDPFLINRDLDWNVQLPFINTNFYLCQVGKKLVDWNLSDVEELNFKLIRSQSYTNAAPRLHNLSDFFETILQYAEHAQSRFPERSFHPLKLRPFRLTKDEYGIWSITK